LIFKYENIIIKKKAKIMLNPKKNTFLTNIDNKELNYTLKLLDRYKYPPKIKKIVHNFINTHSYEELKKVIDSQNIFKFSTKIDESEDFATLKEKLAYELNEQLLKLAF
jgi:hypothetical protein